MKTKTTQALIITAILAAVFLCVYVYATMHISGLTTETKTIRADIEYKEILYKNADNLQKAVQSGAEQKAKIASYFLPAGGSITFISALEKTANDFGLSYNTQNITEENTDDLAPQNKELLRVTFAVSGSWARVMRFVKMVETLPYGMRIDKLDLDASGNVSAGTSTGGTRIWSANIMFSVIKTKDNAN